MADLGKTDAEWLRFLGEEWGFNVLARLRFLREARDRFDKSRTQVLVHNDVDANFGAITLAGVAPGTNATVAGEVYVRVTGSGPYTVTLYKATGGGGGDAVASGAANAGATATLTASNSSGMTGTVVLAGSVTAVTDDLCKLTAILDFPAQTSVTYPGTNANEDDPDSRRAFAAADAAVVARLNGAIADIEQAARAFGLGDAANPRGRGNEFAKANETSLASDVANPPDGSGNVSRARTGLLPTLKAAMADESGSTQYVVKRAPSAAAGVAASSNVGVGTIASHTPAQKCPAGRLTLRCTSDVIGDEEFSGSFYVESSDRPTPVSGLKVGRSWAGPLGFGPITLVRTLAKTGDVGSNTDLAAIAGFAATGETSKNTDDGVLYWTIVANASNWDLSFYKSSTRTTSSLVAKATNYATAAAFVASPQNGSGLTITGTIGSGPTTTTTGTLDLQVFKAANAGGAPDTFTIDVTLAASPGLIQTILAEHFAADGAELNATTSGSETISDDYAKANTFPAYAVQDN